MNGTDISAQFAAKGILPRNVDFQIALAKFQNTGGEYGVALAMLNAAYGKGGKAGSMVPQGLAKYASATLTNDDDKGLNLAADKAEIELPVSSSPQRSGGQMEVADKATITMPSAAPKSHPGHARRGSAAIAGVQEAVAKSLFDTVVLPDGRSLREVHWAECPTLATRYRKISRILMAIHSRGVPSDPHATLDDIVTEAGLEEIVSGVERFNDVA